jgi:hypothetical protein
MALVVHGLIFAGLVSIGSDLGPIWHDKPYRIILAIEFGAGLIAFMISVWAFVACVSPPRSALEPNVPGLDPGSLPPDLPSGELFFLSPKLTVGWHARGLGPLLKGPAGAADKRPPGLTYHDLSEAHSKLSDSRIRSALSAQLLRISLYRTTKSAWARFGFMWLVAEIAFGVAAIATIGIYELIHP